MSAGGGWVRLRCGACGTEFVATDGTRPPPEPPADEAVEPAESPERVHFNEEGVLVTDARFVAPGCTFAMSDVLWCRVRAVPGRWRWTLASVLLLCLAIGMVVTGLWLAGVVFFTAGLPKLARWMAVAVAVVLCGLSVRVAEAADRLRYLRLDRYQVICGVGGHEVVAFSDADEELVKRIAAAVAEAMFPGPA